MIMFIHIYFIIIIIYLILIKMDEIIIKFVFFDDLKDIENGIKLNICNNK